MAATVLRFNNRTTRKPSVQTKVDASALDSPPPGSTGRVLLIGNADGGVPWNVITDPEEVASFRGAEALRAAFRGGDLKEGGSMAFKPARDPRITGAEEVIAIKTNPDTRSSQTFANAFGNAILVQSRDYGPHTNQIAMSIADGTSQGKRITVSFEGVDESKDNIGGVAFLTLQYTEPPTLGWDNMTALMTAAGITANGTRTESGRDGDLQNPALNLPVEVLSSDAGDVGQVVTVYGLIGGVPSQRQLTLNGTNVVPDGQAFDTGGVFGAVLDAACAGTVTIQQAGIPTILFTIAPAALSAGGARAQGMFAAGALTFVADGATTALLMVVGRNAAGSVVREMVTLNGTTPVPTLTTDWAQFDFFALGQVEAARTLTITAKAAETTHAVQNTLLKVRDYFNGRQVAVGATVYGFDAQLGTTRTTYDPANLDLTDPGSPIDVDDPATGSFYADNALIAEYLANESAIVTGSVVAGAIGPPDNTVAPVYLSGGTLGTTTFADWVGALALAKDVECDTVAVLTPDPAVFAELAAHLDFMAGPGQGERDAVVGAMNAAMTGLASLSELRSQIAALNNRNIRVVGQEFDRFNSAGERTTFPPYMLAALVAGAQAGLPLGQSLSTAQLDVLSFGQHSSWNPRDQVEDALEAGLFFLENARNGTSIQRKVVRDVTSAVGSDNPAFTAAEANRILNFVTRETRRDLQFALAQPGFSGTRTALYGRAKKKLNNFVNVEKILKEWKDLEVSISLDRAPVNMSISPVFAVNFIPITFYLYDAPVTGEE